jgi:sugar-specific transcriptional regulator TrmB
LSQEQVLKTLVSFGLTQIDAQVYVFLAKKGAQKGRDIRKALKITKQQLYPSLKNLQKMGIVSSTMEHPARFTAIPFEKVLDLFIRARVEETQRLQQSKAEILSKWQALDIAEADTSRFMVIEGRSYIFSKIRQMIEETKNQISTISTVPSLVQADQYGLFEAGFSHPLKSKIQFRFLTELSSKNVKAMKTLLKETTSAKLNFEGRNPNLGLKLFPRMVIRDEDEAIFFIKPRTETSIVEKDDMCLWTNCKTLVHAFTAIFEELWRYSTDIQKKIVEIETGKPPPKGYAISDVETARKKFNETVQAAKEEIMLLTSSKGLIESWEKIPLLKKLTQRGVSVKIMAPIDRENLEALEQLSKFCTVKHVPINYWRTLIVDGKHLVQFRPTLEQEKPESTPCFESAFYTDDLEYLKMQKTALNDIWKKAQTPSAVKLKSRFGPYGPAVIPLPERSRLKRGSDITVIDFKPPGTITEKDVLNKIINARKFPVKDPSKDVSRLYASGGMAIIHPPDYFNLPDMKIQATHAEKQSSHGGEDYLIIFLWQKTPKGHAFVPVAVAHENPKSEAIFKKMLAGTPAGQNVQLVKNDELQVRIHGKTLFAGWTVPIQLFPRKYILPPACLLIEGYGDVKTAGFTMVHDSGFKSEIEANSFAAFVTFIHPESKYSGPGTDGTFTRDLIMTKYPPINGR